MNILIIGIGNLYRRDDGIGITIAKRLREHFNNEITIKESDGDILNLSDLFQQYSLIIFIDAIKPQTIVGRIHKYDAKTLIETKLEHQTSTHMLSIVEVIKLASSRYNILWHRRKRF